MLFALALCAALPPFEVKTLDPPTSIAGAWECADGDVVDDATRWLPITVPTPTGESACSGPRGWLRTTIAVPALFRDAPLGVSLGEVRGAYEVTADGVKVGGLGEIPPGDGAITDALREGAAFSLPRAAVADGTVEIRVRVARDPGALGTSQNRRLVPNGPVAVGLMPGVNDRAVAEVEARVRDDVAASVATSLLFLFVALYHVLVWALRRDLKGYLWFGVFAFVADVWITIVALAGTPTLPLSAHASAVAGNFVGSLVNVAFIEFFWSYLENRAPPRRWRIFQALLIACALVGFVPVVGIGLTTSPVVIVLKLAMPILAAVEIFRAARRGVREARILFVGIFLAALGAPLQVIVLRSGIHTAISPGQAALAVFFTTMAVALAAQFARHIDAAEKRAKELAETNASIARFVPMLFLRALKRESVREVQRGDAIATTMSVMFCDLRGFTTLAEKMGPDETFRFINRYLEKMEPEIHKAGGFINQYLGDGIMALFPPSASSSSADNAVDAAVGMARALEGINATRTAAGETPLKIGVGVHTGQLMLGTIGGGDQLDSGVVGDVVNTAARLEGITKMYMAAVLISGATLSALTNPAKRALRPLDAVKAKGKTEPLPLIEVLDADPRALKDAKVSSRGELEQALALYRKGNFEDAGVRFGALVARTPDDGAARAFAERCRAFTLAPPEAWDGVLSLTTK